MLVYCGVTLLLCHSLVHVICLFHKCDVPHTCHVTRSYVSWFVMGETGTAVMGETGTAVSLLCICHGSCIYLTRLIHTCDMTHSFVYRTHLSWLMNMFDMTHSHCATWVWHNSFMSVTWVWHNSFMSVTWVWHNSFMSVTRLLIHECDVTTHSATLVWTPAYVS